MTELEYKKFLEDNQIEICPDCGCCEMEWEPCPYCDGEGGFDGDDLMEEDPLWYSSNSFERCDVCLGKGGMMICIGKCENGKHKQE
jgi:hypothetical protein